MRIITYSDLHLAFGSGWMLPPDANGDVMILGGDIVTLRDYEPSCCSFHPKFTSTSTPRNYVRVCLVVPVSRSDEPGNSPLENSTPHSCWRFGQSADDHCFLPQVSLMKINLKTRKLRPSTAASSPLTPTLLFAAFFILVSCLPSEAQNVVLSGAIGGRITDQSGAVVPGVSVVVRNLATGLEQSATTNHHGLYRFMALMPGTYSVTASGKGFHDIEALVRVLVGNTTSQDLRLQVGAGGDTIKVTGEMPLLRPTESSASTVLDRSFIDELPLNGRRYTDFTALTPNTSYDGDTGLISVAGQQGGEDSGYANGNGSNAFTVDGTNATNNYFDDIIGRYRIPYLYGEEAIQEFQVSISPYSAVYGGGAGFVNAVTRSGSNAFHGSAFYYNRNSAVGANDALDNAAGIPKPRDNLQQIGAGMGGPIVRNRLWFFFDYEQQLRSDPFSVINQALDPTQPGFLSSQFGIPDRTPLPAPNGPLPIPNTDIAPDATPGSPYLQQVSNVINGLNLNLGSRSRKRNDLVFTPRLDYQASSRDSLFLSLNFNYFNSPGGVITDPTEGTYGLQTLANANVHTFESSLGWTHTFSYRLLNEFHGGTSQDNEIASPSGLAPNTPTVILDSPAAFTMGNAAFSIGRVFERQYSLSDRVDYLIGKHARRTEHLGFCDRSKTLLRTPADSLGQVRSRPR